MRLFLAALILAAGTTPAAAQWLDRPWPGIPRTADGKPNLAAPAPRGPDGRPDLTGIWNGPIPRPAHDAANAQPWAGLRPMTPKGTPILGASPLPNLFLNTGHGHIGWTMSLGSARIVADAIAGRPAGIDTAGLTLADA